MPATDSENCLRKWKSLIEIVGRSAENLYFCLHPSGEIASLADSLGPQQHFILLKGSFNPIHNGHIGLLDATKRKYPSAQAAFSLSFNTWKRRLTKEDVYQRSQFIHKAGFPIAISRSGRFSHDAAFFRAASPNIRVVFPLGSDTLGRLLEYYQLREFKRLFENAAFEYYARGELAYQPPPDYPNINYLGHNVFSSTSSSSIRLLRNKGQYDALRSLMPAAILDQYLSSTTTEATVDTGEDVPWPLIPNMAAPEVVKSDGVYLYLRNGQQILDAAGGAGVINVGYNRAEVIEAMSSASCRLTYSVPGFLTPERTKVLESLKTHWAPEGLDRIHLTVGGSDAVEAAIVLARKYHVATGRLGRWKVVGRNLSYHGATLGSLSVGGHEARRAHIGELLLTQPRTVQCYCLRCPLTKSYPDCQVACADDLQAVIEREGADSIAAFIAEPIVGASGGAMVPPQEYWTKIEQICRSNNVLIIADEVTTGFGRTGVPFALQHWSIKPDIMVVGKGLTGGYAPLGALFTTAEIVERVAEAGMKLTSHSYAGHPTACAAADAVLEILISEGLLSRVAQLGQELGALLQAEFREHPHVADVRGKGFLWGIEVVRDRGTLERFPQHADVARAIMHAGLNLGVFFYPGGTGVERDFVMISPPFTIGRQEISRIVEVLSKALNVVTALA